MILSLAVVAILIAAGAGVYFYTNSGSDGKDSFEVTTTGLNHFNNYEIDLDDKTVAEHGLKIGEEIELDFGGEKYKGIYTANYNGAPLFGLFVNRNSNGAHSIGMFNYDMTRVIKCETGSKITISHEGVISELIKKTPKYSAGYSNDPKDYSSAAEYANFREVNLGNIKDDFIWRSASPYPYYISERYGYVDSLLEEHGVEYLIMMNINNDAADDWPEDSDYSGSLVRQGKVVMKNLSPAVFSHEDEILFVLQSVIDSEGKLGFSCSLGKDRTGFYVAVLEALAGAPYADIREDYMVSFCNLYKIEPHSEEYETIANVLCDAMFYAMGHTEALDDPTSVDWMHMEYDVDSIDAYSCVHGYLVDKLGVSEEMIQSVIDRITA